MQAVQPALLSRKTKHAMGGAVYEGTTVAPAEDEDNFGRRMLEKLGWKQGEGLGKNKDGMSEHIRVKQRTAGLGLGATKNGPSEYAPPPSMPPPTTATRGSDDESSDESEDEAEAAVKRRIAASGSGVVPGLSDDALFKLCGGARLGMRARASQDGKLRRMEEADRRLREATAGPSSSTGAAGSGGAATGSAEAAAAKAARKALKRADKKRAREEPASGTRSSPRLQAQAAAQGGIPELSLAAGTKAEEKAAMKAAKKAARKAAKKAAREQVASS